jgi:hypothetical protein
MTVKHLSSEELEAGLPEIQAAPADNGELQMIVRRPGTEQREIIERGELSIEEGLVGDNWLRRGSRKTEDGSAHPDMQINIMNARCTALVAGPKERWPLAGDQLYVDMDLSENNLPPGTRLQIGEAQLEITAEPHLGCKKFTARFGRDAMLFVNSERGVELHLRGLNAKVIKAGQIRTGDQVRKLI